MKEKFDPHELLKPGELKQLLQKIIDEPYCRDPSHRNIWCSQYGYRVWSSSTKGSDYGLFIYHIPGSTV